MRRVVPLRRHALALTAALAALVVPAAARADGLVSTPAEVQFGFERLHLPAGEHLGLAGAGYLLEPLPGLHVGPALYGAASGRRGGLFVVGAEVQGRWRLAGSLALCQR